MADLVTAGAIATPADADIIPIRKATVAGLLKITLAQIKGYIGAPKFSVQNEASSAYTAVLADDGKYKRINSATAATLTIPPQSTVVWLADAEITVEQGLVGSVTILAGLGVTLRTRNGVVASTAQYQKANLKRIAADEWLVDWEATAGVGVSTPFAPWTIPLAADFAQVNIGTTIISDSAQGLVFVCPAGQAFETRGVLKAAPAAPWNIYCKVDLSFFAGENNGRTGIALRNTTSGKVMTFGFENDGNAIKYLAIERWSNVNTFNGSATAGRYTAERPWLRLENDGANLNYYIGNGYTWRLIMTTTLAAFIGSVDEIGYMLQSGFNSIVIVNSFSIVAPVGAGGGPA